MARGRPFKKGESGNKGGRPRKDRVITEFQNRKTEDFIDEMQKCLAFTREELKSFLAKKQTQMFEIIIGKIILDASLGNKDARQVLFERILGKVKDKVEHSASDLNAPRIIVQLPDNGRSIIDAIPEPHVLAEEKK